MSATGLDVFDKTLQTTHIWLDDVMETLGADRQVAWKVLSVVLHKVRDCLPVELAAHFGAQLPLLIRGVYYDQFQPGRQPSDCNSAEDFTAEVAEGLRDIRPVDPEEASKAVFATISRHISPGQVLKVKDALPMTVRLLWEGAEARQVAAAEIAI